MSPASCARARTASREGGELAARVLGDVEQRTERARGVQRVARAGEDPRLGPAGGEGAQERRLADPGLAGDEDQPPGAVRADRAGAVGEELELRGALEQRGRRQVCGFVCQGCAPPARVWRSSSSRGVARSRAGRTRAVRVAALGDQSLHAPAPVVRSMGRSIILSTLLIGAAGLGVAACGGSSSDSGTSTAGSSKAIVSVAHVGGSDVLADSAGKTLYSASVEKGGKIRCVGMCTSFWDPMLASPADAKQAAG